MKQITFEAALFLGIFLLICVISYIIDHIDKRVKKNKRSADQMSFTYYAKTKKMWLDHKYRFKIMKDKRTLQYKCFVLEKPAMRRRVDSNYSPHLWYNDRNEKWICWTGEIKNTDQARILCRRWADCTQHYIDTGIPAPGFTHE